MRCIVTGGNGFIGSWVVRKLIKANHEVVIYDITKPQYKYINQKVQYICGDVRDNISLNKTLSGADYVYHLSGILGTHELFDSPREAIDINIHGALNVLLAAKQNKVKRLFFPAKPNNWNNIYSACSSAAEKLAHAYRENYDIDIRILRIWNVYGPGQKQYPVRKIVPYFVSQSLNNLPLEVYGDGNQIIYLMFVNDVAETIVSFLEGNFFPSSTLEIKSAYELSVKELALKIINMTNSKSKIKNIQMRKGEGCSIRRLNINSLFEHEVVCTELSTGLSKTIKWFEENR